MVALIVKEILIIVLSSQNCVIVEAVKSDIETATAFKTSVVYSVSITLTLLNCFLIECPSCYESEFYMLLKF